MAIFTVPVQILSPDKNHLATVVEQCAAERARKLPRVTEQSKHQTAGDSQGFGAWLCCPLFLNVAAPGPLASAKFSIFGIQINSITAYNQT